MLTLALTLYLNKLLMKTKHLYGILNSLPLTETERALLDLNAKMCAHSLFGVRRAGATGIYSLGQQINFRLALINLLGASVLVSAHGYILVDRFATNPFKKAA